MVKPERDITRKKLQGISYTSICTGPTGGTVVNRGSVRVPAHRPGKHAGCMCMRAQNPKGERRRDCGVAVPHGVISDFSVCGIYPRNPGFVQNMKTSECNSIAV